MRNFYHSSKFWTLTINFSEVWPRQTVLAVGLRYVSKDVFKLCYQEQFNLIDLENVLKTSLQDVLKISWRHFYKISWKHLQDVFWRGMSKTNMFVLKTFEYVRLKDVLKTPSEDEDERSLQDVFKTSLSRRMFAVLNYLTLIWVKFWVCFEVGEVNIPPILSKTR